MPFELPELPYAKDALAPVISAETIDFHYGKHHAAYVNNLNNLTEGTAHADASLEEVIQAADGGLFNNAAQVWNHTFYWHCMKAGGGGEPTGALAEALARDFGSVDDFRRDFKNAAVGQFGSGWAWLVANGDGTVSVCSTPNQDSPLMGEGVAGCSGTPLVGLDVWEHAYYLNYQNRRPDYVDAFWNVVDWDAAAARFAAANG